jgi:hypothetical protein
MYPELYKCNSWESTFVEFCVDGINLFDENNFIDSLGPGRDSNPDPSALKPSECTTMPSTSWILYWISILLWSHSVFQFYRKNNVSPTTIPLHFLNLGEKWTRMRNFRWATEGKNVLHSKNLKVTQTKIYLMDSGSLLFHIEISSKIDSFSDFLLIIVLKWIDCCCSDNNETFDPQREIWVKKRQKTKIVQLFNLEKIILVS